MNGLRDKNAGIVRTQFQQERRTVFHHRNELFIAHPSRIKKDVITKVTNGIDHLTSVIDRAVIGAQLNDR